MVESAHISMSKDDSLEERLENYRTAYKNYQDIEASQQVSDEKEWENRLGSQEELKYAQAVARNSLKMAVSNLTGKDVEQAKEQNLVTSQELKQIQELKSDTKSSEKDDQIKQNKEQIRQARANSKSSTKDHDKSRDR